MQITVETTWKNDGHFAPEFHSYSTSEDILASSRYLFVFLSKPIVAEL